MNTNDNANTCGEAHENLAANLEREARAFAARIHEEEGALSPCRHMVIADFEYQYDREPHAGYRVAEGSAAEPTIRWPFHRLAAVAWMVLRFDAGADVPVVEDIIALTRDEADEPAMTARCFSMLEKHPEAALVTWGGEAKDLAVLRRLAGELGLVLPRQLMDLSPYARERIDLCRAVAVQASPVHLSEYAAATAIPCKPSPSKEVGPLVERGDWGKVRDQCLADVLTTSVIALRHLASHDEIAVHPRRSLVALAEAAASAAPASAFVRSTFAPWARAQHAASRLAGTVYRAA